LGGRNYRDLVAWQRAMDLVELVYRTSRTFPKEEVYGLTSQVRRAVASVAANIAEGQGRHSKREFHNFLSIAHGSLREVETHLLIAERLSFASPGDVDRAMGTASEVGRLIQGLMKSLNAP